MEETFEVAAPPCPECGRPKEHDVEGEAMDGDRIYWTCYPCREVKWLRKWQQEACIALHAATVIGQRHGAPMNYGNHDRLLSDASWDPS